MCMLSSLTLNQFASQPAGLCGVKNAIKQPIHTVHRPGDDMSPLMPAIVQTLDAREHVCLLIYGDLPFSCAVGPGSDVLLLRIPVGFCSEQVTNLWR